MTILDILFGQKKSSAPTNHDSYLTNLIKTVHFCQSAPDLAEYARSYSGYVRQAAINQCSNLALAELLPIIVSRLNDWVPAVRQAAQLAFLKLMPLATSRQLLTVLPDVLHLRNTRRTNHQEWLMQVEQSLIDLVPTQELIDAVKSDDVKVARACFSILKKVELLDANTLISLVAKKRNDIVLAVQAILFCNHLTPDEQCEVYLKAMHSHFGAVRTIALNELLTSRQKIYPDVEKDLLAVDALLDLQSSVRIAAMNYLEVRGFDLNEHYKCVLEDASSSAKQIRVSLISLSGLKNQANAALIKAFAKADKPSIRKVALLSWLKLADGDKDAIALAALNDESCSIRKFSLQVVRKYGAYIPFATFYQVLGDKKHYDLLLQFSKNRKWDNLECIARIAIAIQTEPDNTIRPRLVSCLEEWISQTTNLYETPDLEQINFFTSEKTVSTLINLTGENDAKISFLRLALSRVTGSN